MADDLKTVQMFCAEQQSDTPHTLDIDGNGEIVLTCIADLPSTFSVDAETNERTEHAAQCGRFIKLPADTDAAGVKAYLEAHKASNQGQITVDSIEAKKAELLNDLSDILSDAPPA